MNGPLFVWKFPRLSESIDKKALSHLADFGRLGGWGVRVNPFKRKILDENIFFRYC